jgi:transcriptional regulator with XRE-family HTH domain
MRFIVSVEMDNIHDFVVQELERRGKDGWQEVADATNVSVHTIIKVARRHTKFPRYATLQPLAAYFNKARESA